MAPQFTLYGNYAAVSSERVRLMLADQDFTDYEFVNLNVLTAEHKQPPHVARHPWGRIPALVTADGETLYESRVMCAYIARTNHFPLLPPASDILGTARFEQALSAEMSYFSDAFNRLSGEKFSKPLFGSSTDEAEVAKASKELATHFDVLDGLFAKQGGFMAGGTFSLVDIFYIPLVARLIDVGEGDLVLGRTHVRGWWERCLQRERVAAFVDGMLNFEDIKKRLAAAVKKAEEEEGSEKAKV